MENLGRFIGLQRDLAFKTALTRLKKAASADNLVEVWNCEGFARWPLLFLRTIQT